jgi:hypothetical protein
LALIDGCADTEIHTVKLDNLAVSLNKILIVEHMNALDVKLISSYRDVLIKNLKLCEVQSHLLIAPLREQGLTLEDLSSVDRKLISATISQLHPDAVLDINEIGSGNGYMQYYLKMYSPATMKNLWAGDLSIPVKRDGSAGAPAGNKIFDQLRQDSFIRACPPKFV